VEHVNTCENDDLAMEPRFEELRPKGAEILAEGAEALLPLQCGEGTKRDIQEAKEKLGEAQRKAAEAGSLERGSKDGKPGSRRPRPPG